MTEPVHSCGHNFKAKDQINNNNKSNYHSCGCSENFESSGRKRKHSNTQHLIDAQKTLALWLQCFPTASKFAFVQFENLIDDGFLIEILLGVRRIKAAFLHNSLNFGGPHAPGALIIVQDNSDDELEDIRFYLEMSLAYEYNHTPSPRCTCFSAFNPDVLSALLFFMGVHNENE